jgi:hypothetical protein
MLLIASNWPKEGSDAPKIMGRKIVEGEGGLLLLV